MQHFSFIFNFAALGLSLRDQNTHEAKGYGQGDPKVRRRRSITKAIGDNLTLVPPHATAVGDGGVGTRQETISQQPFLQKLIKPTA